MAFDLARLRVTGSETPVVEGLASQAALGGFADYTFSDSGLLLYLTGGTEWLDVVVEWVDRKGVVQPFPSPARRYSALRLSPDGERVVFAIQEEDRWMTEVAISGSTSWRAAP